ncbi:MAG: YggS family pyridoxal phosphate-dependent enzyme [Chloroflexi bacterium]|nr:YggS family pyridoxal phosphate-dependent enzyme [Chloroflexota bacterium]
MSGLVESIRGRYNSTQERIASAAIRAGRDPNSVKLVVVTKSQPLEIVQASIEAGVRILGENYAEEGAAKIQAVGNRSAVEWHMIGHVQSRKAQTVVRNFDFMHSLDGLKLAGRLDRFSAEEGRILPVLLEFNVGGEGSKSGWPAWDETRWSSLLEDVAAITQLRNLNVRGLMSMPPIGNIAEESRPYFQKMVGLQQVLCSQFPQVDFLQLSMGTSLDYEIAVEEGATLVRIGTAIVGPRTPQSEAE